MPAPDYAWLDATELRAILGASATGVSEQELERARKAAAAYVEETKRSLVYVDALPADIPANVTAAAQLYAGRLLARKASPGGIATYGEFGPASVMRTDPDVDRLLGVGRFARPEVR